jgi:hypothetical protein
MPYIDGSGKQHVQDIIKEFVALDGDLTVGELNYIITKLLLSTHPKNYEDYNALLGVLGCVELEFYRRAVSVYEDKKIKKNGDVY